jgi:ABC-type phosphate/phosphonate transport system substrate-binding protein
MRMQRLIILVCPLALGAALAVAPSRAAPPAASTVRIGMLSSMFKDVPPAMFNALSAPLYSLVQAQTGLKSDLVLVPTPDELWQQMDEGKIQFGVFHGFEFAWMKQKQPALHALMIAAPQYRPIRVFLVVHSTSTASEFGDVKDKALAFPTGSREYSKLFLDRSCLALGKPAEAFFAKVTRPKTAEDALHDVVDNTTVQAAVVDGAAIQSFTERNPARAKRIKVIATSEVFPPSVVAYRDGSLDADVIRRFRDGMSNAHSTQLGRQLLSLMLMNGFEPIPSDYAKALADIAKAYPPPGEEAK